MEGSTSTAVLLWVAAVGAHHNHAHTLDTAYIAFVGRSGSGKQVLICTVFVMDYGGYRGPQPSYMEYSTVGQSGGSSALFAVQTSHTVNSTQRMYQVRPTTHMQSSCW